MDKQCLNCQKSYHAARASSRYCSATCRKQANRDADEAPTQNIPSVNPPNPSFHQDHYVTRGNKNYCTDCDYKLDTDNEWSHSACWRTQEEIEKRYTLENYPHLKYHTSGGGGSGRTTPVYN